MEEKKESKEKTKKGISKELRNKYILAILIVLGIFIVDQAFKIYSVTHLQGVNVDSGIGLTYQQNYSGAFGVKFNSKTMYTLCTLVVLILLGSFIKKQAERLDKLMIGTLSVTLAGGLSNVLDKLIHGYVIDYIKFSNTKLPVTSIGEILMILSWFVLAGIFAKATYKDIQEKNRLKAKRQEVKNARLENNSSKGKEE